MASKLCCTLEEEEDGRPDSPTLPNARISEATPANKPLLPKEIGSFNSHFTSTRTEDLHELQNIFTKAHDDASTKASPSRPARDRASRPSIISLRSLHRMTSMRSIIRNKFSKDLSKTPASKVAKRGSKDQTFGTESSTLVKHQRDGTAPHIQITKDDLRRNLLTHKKPHEGGYDSDAEVLDDIAKNIGKKTTGKRPSIHEIEWTPSSGSRSTPDSSSRTPSSANLKINIEPYNVQRPHNVSFTAKIAQVFSTPNLRAESASERDRRLRRSHSATSMGLPKPSPVSPLRLPSLLSHDRDGTPWSEVMHESLRLSQFPVPPRHETPKPSETSCDDTAKLHHEPKGDIFEPACDAHIAPCSASVSSLGRKIGIRVQQPTSIATPRASTSVRGAFRENQTPVREINPNVQAEKEDDGETDPRRSVHLYSMRISHHLRSGSMLSWDQLADAPDLSTPRGAFRERSISEQAQFINLRQQSGRHERQASSSGFASSKVPIRWGRVLAHESEPRGDMASSIYSSRPQSPRDTFGGSMLNLSVTGSGPGGPSLSSIDILNLRRSNSFPTDNEDTPRPTKHRVMANLSARPAVLEQAPLNVPARSARKNSVAETKQSKFREEFSPSPPRKRLTPSTSIMKFLNPKRLSLRSQSEASLRPISWKDGLDGTADGQLTDDKERRHSRSIMSLRTEQHALNKDHDSHNVWGQALKAHHEEKAAMFRPQNRELAVRGSPFRERSGSFNSPRPSEQDDTRSHKRLSVPLLDPQSRGSPGPSTLIVPRTRGQGETSQDFAKIFEKQLADDSVGGAWGRYPSHTREDRALDAGRAVETRDFALEAAIRFATNEGEGHDEDLVDPMVRNPSPPLEHGQKKRKKKIGNGKMAKSHSMTFARKFISSYYAGIFKSSSSEFRMHGRGHRSSIASGGNLEHPELELLPAVFMSRNTDGAADQKLRLERHAGGHHFTSRSDTDSQKELNATSMSTLRPRRNSSAPNLNELHKLCQAAEDSDHPQDRARVWSTYYENCVSLFPRASTDTDMNLEDFRWPRRASQESRRASLHMPPRSARHNRRASQLSRGMLSPDSPRPSFALASDGDGDEDKSFVSVRQSTMDLMEKFKEQELTEHERVLSLTKSRGGGAGEEA